MTIKKILIGLGILVLVVTGAAGIFFGLYIYPFMKSMKETKTISYDDKLTLVLGGGGNTGILDSDSLVLVVDTKMDEAADDLADRVKSIAGNKPVLVVNTHIHSDHAKGNALFKGQSILAGGNYTKEQWAKENGEETMPTRWLKDTLILTIGSEKVIIFNLGSSAHTQSDVMVYLTNRQVLFGGDVILNKQAPAMFAQYYSNAEGYLGAFDSVMKRFEIKTVVPGHGAIGGVEVISLFKEYFIEIQAAAKDKSKEDEIIKKYESWKQIPFVMDPAANIRYIRKLGIN